MRRSAIVRQAAIVSMPDDGEPALQIITDYPIAAERAFYLRPDSEPPAVGEAITWGDQHAWYADQVARKLGYGFDPDAALR